MSSCMASHLPPPEKDGGGAAATASRTAWIRAAILSGSPSRNSIVGVGRAGSSSLWRWKKWISHGSGTGITTGQARDKPLDLPDNRADRGEVGRGQGPVGRDDERNLAVRERPALVKHRLGDRPVGGGPLRRGRVRGWRAAG